MKLGDYYYCLLLLSPSFYYHYALHVIPIALIIIMIPYIVYYDHYVCITYYCHCYYHVISYQGKYHHHFEHSPNSYYCVL